MSDVEMKVDGLSDLEARLVDMGAQLGVKVLASACRKAMKPVQSAAKSNVPVWSGSLRDAIKLTVMKPKQGEAVVVAGLYIGKSSETVPGELPPARRWHFIELGTSKYAAHPFLRPALDAQAANILSILKAEIDTGIDRMIRKQGAGL